MVKKVGREVLDKRELKDLTKWEKLITRAGESTLHIELKRMVLDMWRWKPALCYTEYPVLVDGKRYIVDVAVFVYKEYPIKEILYAHFDKGMTVKEVTIFDWSKLSKTIAYECLRTDVKKLEKLRKVFDEVVVLTEKDLVEYYRSKIDLLSRTSLESLSPLFEYERWFSKKISIEPLKLDSVLQIRANRKVIELFKYLKKISGARTSQDFLLWLMWKATLALIYEHVGEMRGRRVEVRRGVHY